MVQPPGRLAGRHDVRQRRLTLARGVVPPGRWPRRGGCASRPMGRPDAMNRPAERCRERCSLMRLPYGATVRNGATYGQRGMVPPAGGTAWCRLWAARFPPGNRRAARGVPAAGLLPGGHGAADRRHCTAARLGGSKWGGGRSTRRMAGAKDAEWRPFNARPWPVPARQPPGGAPSGGIPPDIMRGGRWTAGRARPPPGFRRRHAMAADRRHACTPGRWPRRVWCPPERCRRWAARFRAADGWQEWCCLSAAPAGRPAIAGRRERCRLLAARHGAAYWRHGIRRHGMVPPIGGTAWCRLLAARHGAAYWRHGIRRHGWGGGGRALRGLAKDAWGRPGFRTPGGVLFPGPAMAEPGGIRPGHGRAGLLSGKGSRQGGRGQGTGTSGEAQGNGWYGRTVGTGGRLAQGNGWYGGMMQWNGWCGGMMQEKDGWCGGMMQEKDG